MDLAKILSLEPVTTFLLGWIPRLLSAGLAFLVFWALWKATARLLTAVFTRAQLDLTASAFVLTILRFTFTIVGALTVLAQLGVDTTSVLTSLGVMGLTIGFAAQDTLSNIISGLFIFWDRPFVLGDLVEVDGEYGRVDQITLRSTRVVTPDGRMLAIPNKVVASGKVASYTNFPNLRLDIDLTVGVTEDLDRIRRILLDLVAADPDFLAQPPPAVVVTALNDYNVAMQLRAWLEDEKTHVRKRLALRESAFEALRSAGVEMPFETLEIRRPAQEPR